MRTAVFVAFAALSVAAWGGTGTIPVSDRELPVFGVVTVDTLLSFAAASGMDIAPDGTIYVTDSGRNAVVVRTATRTRVEGGPGTEAGQFDRPSGIDVGAGLVIHVADTGNRRIQRFSREFRHLGSIVVDRSAFRNRPQPPADRTPSAASEEGRPIDVATGSADELFVLDENARAVLRWDEAGRPDRIIGEFGSGAGELLEPVAIATDGNRFLFVADASRSAVLVYDLNGTYDRTILLPNATRPTSLAHDGTARLLVAHEDGIYIVERNQLVGSIELPARQPLVGLQATASSLYLLTLTSLLRAPMPDLDR